MVDIATISLCSYTLILELLGKVKVSRLLHRWLKLLDGLPWIFLTDVLGAQKMNPHDFCDLLTFVVLSELSE